MEQFSGSTLLVRPEHLNHHGYLFGGRLLEWLDEQAYIASMSHMKPDCNLVTVAIDRVEFKFPVGQGTLLHFRSNLVHVGRTSITLLMRVYRHALPDDEEIFRAYVTQVCLDNKGKPRSVAPVLLRPFSREKLAPELQPYWHEVENARRGRVVTKFSAKPQRTQRTRRETQ